MSGGVTLLRLCVIGPFSAAPSAREQLQQGLRDVGGRIDISAAQLQQIVESAMRAGSGDLISRIDMEMVFNVNYLVRSTTTTMAG